MSCLAALVKRQSIDVLVLALHRVQTVEGAERVYWAERGGLNRPVVLRAAARRIEECGGTEPERARPMLLISAASVDVDQVRWEAKQTWGHAQRKS